MFIYRHYSDMMALLTRRTFYAALLLIFQTAGAALNSQTLYKSESGTISFFSSAPLEDIKAEVSSFSSELDPATSSVTFTVPIKGFVFRKNLMQQHFNEQYMESDRFPSAFFTGKLERTLDAVTEVNRPVTLKVSGILTIKGIERPLEEEVTLFIKGDEIEGKTVFKVRLADFGIKIPRVFIRNIAEAVEVTVQVRYKKLN